MAGSRSRPGTRRLRTPGLLRWQTSSLLARLRLVALVLALISALAMIVTVLGTGPGSLRVGAGVILTLGLVALWTWGARRGSFPVALDPVEVVALYLLLRLTPGNPLLPLCGLVLRSLYGSAPRVWLRYVAWSAALLLAHASRGAIQLHQDLARVGALALIPAVFQVLRSSLERLEGSEQRLASLVQNSTDVVTVVGPDQRVRWQADSIRAVLHLDPSALLDCPLTDLIDPADHWLLDNFFRDAAETPGLTRTLRLRIRHGDGGYREFDVVAADRTHDRSVAGFVLNMRDATERLKLELELRELAHQREIDSLHDPLTGLANRRALFQALDQVTEGGDPGERRTLLLIDLDRFKELNDALGHHVGDQLLREIGPRLLSCLDPGDLVARLGGDEFALLLAPRSHAEPERIAERLRETIEQPFEYQGLSLLVEASIGIAMYPDHGTEGKELLQRADVAMYAAKRARTGHVVYEPGSDAGSRDRVALLGELPSALATDQLVLHYQPKFDLRSMRIVGTEALVRWQHPERGLLGPDAFLPVVEQTGLMRQLTLWVLEEALAQHARWRELGLTLPVAINLAAPNLLDLALPQDIARLLAEYEIAPAQLVLEITERIMPTDPMRIMDVLTGLRDLGIELALDDFGTGSSSLSFVRLLPIQELKIDRSFVKGISAGDGRASAIVRTIIALAHDLMLRSVVEGIETDLDRARLTSWGCDVGQGFGLARPMVADRLTELAPQWSGTPSGREDQAPAPRTARGPGAGSAAVA